MSGIDPSVAEVFFAVLLGADPPGNLMLGTLPPKVPGVEQPFGVHFVKAADLREAARLAATLARTDNVYFGLGLLPESLAGGRGAADDVIAIPCLWAEVDVRHPCHKKQELPPTLDDALRLISRLPLPPSIVIDSGHGLHCYWLLKELWLLDTPQEREAAARLCRRLGATLKAYAKEMGWEVDSVSDLARVLRPPGTLNHNGGEVLPVRFLEMDDERRYDPSDFDSVLDAETQPAAEPDRSDSADAVAAGSAVPPDDQVIIDRILRNPKYARLWSGDASGYPSDSEADYALLGNIAFYAGKDPARIERLAQQSALARAKWDERDDYLPGSIRKILERKTRFYNWNPELDDLHRTARLCTDVGNAARFVKRYGDQVRYCHGWGRWLVWTGTRWAADDRGYVVKLAKRTALAIFEEAKAAAEDVRRQGLAEFAVKSQKRERISAMLDLAKPELAVTPDELDADPWLLNCLNGTVDLRTGALRPHRRDDYLTKVCRAAYGPDAPAPVLQRFLGRIFRTYPELIAYVQKVMGYAATGLTSEQVLFFLYGKGANGKTTLLDPVLHVLGDYAGKADRDLLTAAEGAVHPTNVADLMGKRLVVCSETNEGRRFDEARLKDLVGETRLKARFMRCDFFEFTATHKVFLYSNHKPLVRGTDLGFWRRMRMVPFVETIAEEEKDKCLVEKLKAEADGILGWMVRGCLLWQREGLGLPDEVARATDGYRREMDSVGLFLQECCFTGERFEASSQDLYVCYCGWCEDAGEKPVSQKRLGMQLAERGYESDRDSRTNRKKWLGIGLKELRKTAPEGSKTRESEPSEPSEPWSGMNG